jgi:hypothetical protein
LIGFVSFDFGLMTVSSCFLVWFETVRDQPVPTLAALALKRETPPSADDGGVSIRDVLCPA